MIREASPDDIDELFELWRELLHYHQGHHAVFKYNPNQEHVLKNELLTRIKDKNTRVFVYMQQDAFVGMIITSFKEGVSGFKLSRKGLIAETVVKASHRGSGIGKELLEAARNWLEDRGADHIELQVSVKNEAGLSFWQNQGFTPSTYHMILELKDAGKKK